jgi:hypothetical protein
MKAIGFLAFAATLLVPPAGVRAQPPRPQVSDRFEITLVRDSAERTDGDSTGSSHDRDALVERVIAVRDDGLELEYDLPQEAERQAINWQFPARIFRANDGAIRLLNRAELEARVDAWLKEAKWTRELCGHWYFTWNAFQVECDPDSVIDTIRAFDLRSVDPREGAIYRDRDALAAAPLARKKAGPGGSTWAAELSLDPERMRRDRAESDVAVGEILNKPTTFEAALRERAKEKISGTISVRFDADPYGNVWRRTKVERMESRGPDGKTETRTVTETLERHIATPSAAQSVRP